MPLLDDHGHRVHRHRGYRSVGDRDSVHDGSSHGHHGRRLVPLDVEDVGQGRTDAHRHGVDRSDRVAGWVLLQ